MKETTIWHAALQNEYDALCRSKGQYNTKYINDTNYLGPISLRVDEFISRLWNHVKSICALISMLMIQSVHNFAHVTTALMSWYVQTCELIRSLFFTLQEQHNYYNIWIITSSLLFSERGSWYPNVHQVIGNHKMSISAWWTTIYVSGA